MVLKKFAIMVISAKKNPQNNQPTKQKTPQTFWLSPMLIPVFINLTLESYTGRSVERDHHVVVAIVPFLIFKV